MATVIIIENGATKSALDSTVARLVGMQVLVAQGNDQAEGVKALSRQILSMPEQISSPAVLLDARATITAADITMLADAVATEAFAACIGMCQEGNDLRPEALLQQISSDRPWSISAVAASGEALRAATAEAQTWEELMPMVLITALAEGDPIQCFEQHEAGIEQPLTEDARSRVLKRLINSVNIEELFPAHAWNSHQKESAAACYHALAALFIRLNDFQSAMECLEVSDQLEDSPRSLALKGIIAISQGEALTAVANMVSSLQQYEQRKRSSEAHYLSFAPRDLDEVNHRLNMGLKALNQRDNNTAAAHFAEAIYNFDSFYKEYRLK